jgi:hypothetical protein
MVLQRKLAHRVRLEWFVTLGLVEQPQGPQPAEEAIAPAQARGQIMLAIM